MSSFRLPRLLRKRPCTTTDSRSPRRTDKEAYCMCPCSAAGPGHNRSSGPTSTQSFGGPMAYPSVPRYNHVFIFRAHFRTSLIAAHPRRQGSMQWRSKDRDPPAPISERRGARNRRRKRMSGRSRIGRSRGPTSERLGGNRRQPRCASSHATRAVPLLPLPNRRTARCPLGRAAECQPIPQGKITCRTHSEQQQLLIVNRWPPSAATA